MGRMFGRTYPLQAHPTTHVMSAGKDGHYARNESFHLNRSIYSGSKQARYSKMPIEVDHSTDIRTL